MFSKETETFFLRDQIVFDEDDRQRNFPQHITSTGKRPDVVIYSNKLKKVYLML